MSFLVFPVMPHCWLGGLAVSRTRIDYVAELFAKGNGRACERERERETEQLRHADKKHGRRDERDRERERDNKQNRHPIPALRGRLGKAIYSAKPSMRAQRLPASRHYEAGLLDTRTHITHQKREREVGGCACGRSWGKQRWRDGFGLRLTLRRTKRRESCKARHSVSRYAVQLQPLLPRVVPPRPPSLRSLSLAPSPLVSSVLHRPPPAFWRRRAMRDAILRYVTPPLLPA
ncbi:hypothetical protein LY78DRAFT_275266 [Colletotrichum sublineola]|nr:hypothetical protein LY78DRAFT_275266 [Colletotrichum sublineola]